MIMNHAPPHISMSDITGYNCFGWTVQGLIFCQPDTTMQPKHNVEIWGRGKKKPHASMQWGGAAALPHFWVENKCVSCASARGIIEPQFKGEKNGFCAGAAMQNDVKRFFRNPLIFDGVFSEDVFSSTFSCFFVCIVLCCHFLQGFLSECVGIYNLSPQISVFDAIEYNCFGWGLDSCVQRAQPCSRSTALKFGGDGRQKLAC